MTAVAKTIYEVEDRASANFKKIGANAKRVDQELDRAGRSATRFGDRSAAGAQKGSASAKQMERAYKQMADESVGRLEKLSAAIQIVGQERATATVDVDIAKAEAKLRVLKAELRSVSTQEARAELQELGLVATSVASTMAGRGGGSGGGGGGMRGGLAGGFAAAGGRALFLASSLAVLTPAIVALGGATGALVGSGAAAVGGAGVLGVGTLGALAVGLGGVISVVKPAAAGLKEVQKAQEAYNRVLQQYGRDSAQAAQAREKLNKAQGEAPGAATVLRDKKVFSDRWKNRTRAGRRDAYGLMSDGLGGLDALSSTTAPIANESVSATRVALRGVMNDLRGGEWREVMRAMGDTFGKLVGPAAQSIENLALFFGRVGQAASPQTIRMFESLEGWTDGIAKGAGDQERLTRRFDRWIDQTKTWGRFLQQSGRLMGALFSPGARPGERLVERMTGRMERWTRWLDRNPAKVEAFFDRSVDSAVKLAKAIGEIARMAAKAGDALMPMLNAVSTLTGGLGSSGMLGPVSSLAAMAALTRGRGVAFGRSAGAAGGGMTAAAGGAGFAAAAGGRGFQAIYQSGRALGAGRAAAAAGALGGLSGAGAAKFIGSKFLLPMAAIGGLVGAAQGTGGAGAPGLALNAVTGATGALGMNGIYNRLGIDTRNVSQRNSAAVQRDFDLIDKNVGAYGTGGVKGAQDQLSTLGRMLKAARTGDAVSDEHRKGVVDRLQQEIEARKALLPTLRAEKNARSRDRGNKYSDSIREAYETQDKAGDKDAFKDLVSNVRRGMNRKGPGAKIIAEDGLDMVREAAGNNPKLIREYEKLAKSVEKRFDNINAHVDKTNGNIYTGTSREWKRIRRAITDPAELALQKTKDAFTGIQKEAIGSIMAMGYTRKEAQEFITGMDGKTGGAQPTPSDKTVQVPRTTSGNPVTSNPFGGGNVLMNARGGRLRGIGMQDTISIAPNAKAAPGELIVNQHSERKADERMGFPGALAALVNGEHMPHGLRVAFAKGGRTMQGLMSQLGAAGFTPSSTTGGKHAPGSYHYKGMAADYGDATSNLRKLWRILYPRRKDFVELFGPSYLKPGPTLMRYGQGFHNAALQASHEDHIHVALAGAMAGALGDGGDPSQAIKLNRLGKQTGVPRKMRRSAHNGIVRAMEAKINARLAEQSGGGSTLSMDPEGSSATVKQARKWLAAGLRLAGVPASAENVSTLLGRAKQESGLNPRAVNNWDVNAKNGDPSKGLLQTIGATFNRYKVKGHDDIFNPVDNTAAAVRYMMDRYGRLVGQSSTGYSMGGRIPWLGKGGELTAHKPTLIGVGDRQAERVRVTPLHDTGKGGGEPTIQIRIDKIVNREEGDIEAIIERELKKVGKRLAAATTESEF